MTYSEFMSLDKKAKKLHLQMSNGRNSFIKESYYEDSYYQNIITFKLSLNYKLLTSEKLATALIYNKKSKSYLWVKYNVRRYVSIFPREMYTNTEFKSKFYINMYGRDLSHLDLFYFSKKQLLRINKDVKNRIELLSVIFPNVDSKLNIYSINNAFIEYLNLKKIQFDKTSHYFQGTQAQTLVCSEMKDFIVNHARSNYSDELEFLKHFFEKNPLRIIPYININIFRAFTNNDLEFFTDKELESVVDVYQNNPKGLVIFERLKRVPLGKLYLFANYNYEVPF